MRCLPRSWPPTVPSRRSDPLATPPFPTSSKRRGHGPSTPNPLSLNVQINLGSVQRRSRECTRRGLTWAGCAPALWRLKSAGGARWKGGAPAPAHERQPLAHPPRQSPITWHPLRSGDPVHKFAHQTLLSQARDPLREGTSPPARCPSLPSPARAAGSVRLVWGGGQLAGPLASFRACVHEIAVVIEGRHHRRLGCDDA